MKRKAKANKRMIGIISGVAIVGALVYPAIRLAKFLRAKIAERRALAGGEESPMKAFSPAYRGKHKPHHRHANGHHAAGPETA